MYKLLKASVSRVLNVSESGGNKFELSLLAIMLRAKSNYTWILETYHIEKHHKGKAKTAINLWFGWPSILCLEWQITSSETYNVLNVKIRADPCIKHYCLPIISLDFLWLLLNICLYSGLVARLKVKLSTEHYKNAGRQFFLWTVKTKTTMYWFCHVREGSRIPRQRYFSV